MFPVTDSTKLMFDGGVFYALGLDTVNDLSVSVDASLELQSHYGPQSKDDCQYDSCTVPRYKIEVP